MKTSLILFSILAGCVLSNVVVADCNHFPNYLSNCNGTSQNNTQGLECVLGNVQYNYNIVTSASNPPSIIDNNATWTIVNLIQGDCDMGYTFGKYTLCLNFVSCTSTSGPFPVGGKNKMKKAE